MTQLGLMELEKLDERLPYKVGTKEEKKPAYQGRPSGSKQVEDEPSPEGSIGSEISETPSLPSEIFSSSSSSEGLS